MTCNGRTVSSADRSRRRRPGISRTTNWLSGFIGAVALLAAGAAANPPAAAAPYVVDQAKGDDAAVGSQAAPWRTTSRGVRDLKPGDTLTVSAGVYRETVTVTCRGTAEAPITIIFLCNWNGKTEFKYDYKTPLDEKYGSTVNVPQYMKGDLDGDGKRDIPDCR